MQWTRKMDSPSMRIKNVFWHIIAPKSEVRPWLQSRDPLFKPRQIIRIPRLSFTDGFNKKNKRPKIPITQ